MLMPMPMASRVARLLIYPECPLFPRRLPRHPLVARRAILRSPQRTAPPRLRTTQRESPDILCVLHLARPVVRRVSPRLVSPSLCPVRSPRSGNRLSAVHVSHHSPPSRVLRIKPPPCLITTVRLGACSQGAFASALVRRPFIYYESRNAKAGAKYLYSTSTACKLYAHTAACLHARRLHHCIRYVYLIQPPCVSYHTQRFTSRMYIYTSAV